VIGGVPAGGLSFGAAINAQAIIDQPSQFDFYDGGGLDIAFLGLAQADREGNLNVSKFGPGWPAPAASSTSAKTPKRWSSWAPSPPATWRLRCEGALRIPADGKARKFVEQVEHRTFSGPRAAAGQDGALHHRALRVSIGAGGPRTDRTFWTRWPSAR
jgi:propionate CoA-transferase